MNRARFTAIFVSVTVMLTLVQVSAASFWVQDDWQSYQCDWFSVSSANDSVAWAVGEEPRKAFVRSGSPFAEGTWSVDTLLHYDGFDTDKYRLNDVFVLPSNPSHVWIVGERQDTTHRGVVLYSVNGGINWTPVFPLEGVESITPFYAVHFADQYRGYIGAGNGMVLKSVNGGQSWTQVEPPGSMSDCITDIWTYPGGPDTVWAIGDNSGLIAKSVDGGGSWTACGSNVFNRTYQIPGLTRQFSGKVANLDLAFQLPYKGGISVSHGSVVSTADAGQTWIEHDLESNSIWFAGADYGCQDSIFLAGNWGVIREDPGEIEQSYRSFHMYDIDLAGTAAGAGGFAVGGTAGSQTGRAYRRSDPAGFVFEYIRQDSCYTHDEDDRVAVTVAWHTTFERNTGTWTLYRSVTPFLTFAKFNVRGTNAMGNTDTTSHYVLDGSPASDYNTTYYYWIGLQDLDYNNYYMWGPETLAIYCENFVPATPPDAPEDLSVSDVPDDEGGALKLEWDPQAGAENCRVGRSTSQDGVYFMVNAPDPYPFDTLTDATALTGKGYYYQVASVGDFAASDPINNSSTAIDNNAPDAVGNLEYVRQERTAEGDTILIWLEWSEVEDSTLAGYWVCPEVQSPLAREIVHLSPIQRNWYVVRGDWNSGRTVTIGVLPMDFSDNMDGNNWNDIDITVANYQTAHWDATAHNNASRIGQSSDTHLHFGFNSKENDTDFVYYQKSTDEGSHWTTPTKVGRGRDPCLRLTTDGTPYMIWRMTEPSVGNLVGKLYFSKYSQGQWITPVEIFSTTAPEFAVGSPAAVTAKNLSHIVWEARKNTGGIGYSDIVFAGYLDLNAGSPSLTYQGIDTVWSGGPTLDSTESSPSVDVDLEGRPHVVWQKGNDIYYVAKGPSGWPSNHENISGTSSSESRNAHIDLQGDWVRAVWEEQHSPATQYYDVLLWSYWNGAGIECSQTSSISSNCLEPVIDGNFILWSEKVGSHYEVFVSAYDYETYSWSDSANISSYPYGDSRYPQVITEAIRSYLEPEIYCAWTEGSAGYWTRFQKETFTKKQPYYPHDLGLEAESPVTVERDGYITYGSSTYETVDYDADTLEYECNLDSVYEYTLELTYYHEGESGREYELIIDGTPVDTSSVSSEEKTTVSKEVPEAAVQDGQITIEIASTGGDTVTCGDFLLFQSSPEGGMGGGQAVTHRRPALPLRPTLKAPNPNPSRGRPTIEYFLPDERYTNVQVFDVSGRLVETLASGRQKSGWHKAVWNSENNGAGVYFCRMNAGDVCVTQKLVLVR